MFLFSRELQQLTIDLKKKKRDINVYRSNVKITAHNLQGYQITRQIPILEIFCRARLCFLFKYFVKKVLFYSLCFGLRSLPPPKAKQNPELATSCVDYLRSGTSESGIYKLYDQNGKSYTAYCDMKSELDTAWTMVMSWCTTNRKLPGFVKYPFNYNSPQNEDALNWDLYRLSLARIRYL